MNSGTRAGAGEFEGAFAERANPAFDLIIIFGIGRRRDFGGQSRRRCQIAVIFDGKIQLLEHAADARGP